MTTQHTSGRLKTRKGFDTDTIEIFKPDRSIKKPFFPTELATVNAEDKEGKANARRLVAAWNACEGISTEALEAYGDKRKHPFKDLFLDMEQKENELRAALSGLLSYFESGNSVPVDKATIKADSPEVIDARAAIQKVEGK